MNISLTTNASLTVAAWLLFFVFSPAASYAKEWRGITPGLSTRSDVVRLLGQCSGEKPRCVFSSDEGEVSIVFAGAVAPLYACAVRLPADTVLLIDLMPKAKLRLSDLGGGETRFKELAPPDSGDFQYRAYLDEESGVLAHVADGLVQVITYIAAAKDRHICPDYYTGVEAEQYPICRLPIPELSKFSQFATVTASYERAALDGFAAELRDEPLAQAYLIAYAGRKSREGEAQAMAERAKAYLTSKHGMEDGRIVVVDGGYREESALELFIVPVGATPPSPTPTVDVKDVQIIPDKKVKKPSDR